MSALADIAAAADPLLRPYRLVDPGEGRFERRFRDADRAFVFEAVHEGFLMHYGTPRAFSGMDADLRLLAGDALYALGLARLAELGDLDAVTELADLISLSAMHSAEGTPELTEGLWEAGARFISGGGGPRVRETVAA